MLLSVTCFFFMMRLIVAYGNGPPVATIVQLFLVYFIIYVVDNVFLNQFVADGTRLIHTSCFSFFDFILTFVKMVHGTFSSIYRVFMILIASFISIFLSHTCAFPVGVQGIVISILKIHFNLTIVT